MELEPGEYVWVQVAEEIRRRIRAGIYKPRHPVPGAPRLAEEFGIAKRTAARALDELKKSGELYTLIGRGTFVSPPSVGEADGQEGE